MLKLQLRFNLLIGNNLNITKKLNAQIHLL